MIILVIISALSLYPLQNLPDLSSTDKLQHLIAYIFLSLSIGIKKPNKWLLFLILLMIYSGCIEIIQPYLNRYGEIADFFYNVLGLSIGFSIGRIIKLKLR